MQKQKDNILDGRGKKIQVSCVSESVGILDNNCNYIDTSYSVLLYLK